MSKFLHVKKQDGLSVDLGQSLVGLHDILSPHARNLKVLDLTVSLYDESLDLPLPLPLSGLSSWKRLGWWDIIFWKLFPLK